MWIFLAIILCPLANAQLSLSDRCVKAGVVNGKAGFVHDQACADAKKAAFDADAAKVTKVKTECAKATDDTIKALCDALVK